MSHHRETIDAPGAPSAVGPYSHAVKAGGLIFISGQVPFDPETMELIEGSIGEQTTRCLQNLQAVAEAAGASLASDAVKLTVFATDLVGDWPDINEAYAAFFAGGQPPARAAIGVAQLPKGAQVEIEAIVAVPD